MVLGLFGVVLLVVGGTTWSTSGRSAAPRLLALLAAIVLTRVAVGPAAAAVVTLLLTLGAWFRIRLAETVMGFAVFGAVVAVLGGVSLRLVITLCVVGSMIVLFRALAVRIWSRCSRRASLTVERTAASPLAREN